MYVCGGRELPCTSVKFIKLWQHLVILDLLDNVEQENKIYFQN